MSPSRRVPVALPSLRQTEIPDRPSSAVKYSRFELAERYLTPEPPDGFKSVTMTVPVSVPSLTHSSCPCTPSSATKYTRLPSTVREPGDEPTTPGTISRTSAAALPVALQSSSPPSEDAENISELPKAVADRTFVTRCPLPSSTGTVPVAKPSLTHNSRPAEPCTVKYNRLPTATRS